MNQRALSSEVFSDHRNLKELLKDILTLNVYDHLALEWVYEGILTKLITSQREQREARGMGMACSRLSS